MKAYLIDPFAKAITEVDHSDTLQDIYSYIDADCMDAVRLGNNGDTIYVDDNGLYRQPQAFFFVEDYACPIAGKGLVLGSGSQGESCDVKRSLEELEGQIHFVSAAKALERAEQNDALAAANEAKAKEKGFAFIHVSAADIMKEHEYTDPSE